MFTIKFYSADGFRQTIEEADSFTVLRSEMDGPNSDDFAAEITLHRKIGEDKRIDIGDERKPREGWPPVFHKAIIENSNGKTTEIIVAGVLPGRQPAHPEPHRRPE